ncbi:MAG: efflux RND transporter permease subunit [Planctomycetes bacterium]|nr:efflux RND transporter permease subunit [Planctomycetota bacterium]
MLNRIIDTALRQRLLVILAAIAFAVAGGVSLWHLDIDAFPDTTPVQVQINATAPSLGPEEVEQQITFPVEQALSGLPRLQTLRSVSKFGLSQVAVTFDDGTDIYFARQLVNERLGTVVLPHGIERPTLGPVSTGLGEVFHYIVSLRGWDFSQASEEERVEKLTYLRTIHDWSIKPKLRTVRGVAEINSWGGYEKQYQVHIDPDRLIKHDLAFAHVVEALENNNRNVGGGGIRKNSQFLLVHGLGRTVNEEQIRNIVVASQDGVPIRVRDVAEVRIGHEIRRGAVTAHGRGEAILGLCFMTMGQNSKVVASDLQRKLNDIRGALPSDVQVDVVYDRTELVEFVMDTVRRNLFEGGLLVVAVLFLFLGNLRAAAIVAVAIPLSMLFAFSGMLQAGIAASLLSLGAIDFGMVVDSSVVMIENCARHLAHGDPRQRSKIEVIRNAAVEVRKPTLFGELIIMVVYLPILTLEGIEGKLFRPMALTVIFALIGSMILSMTLMPVLASVVLPRRIEGREPWLMRMAHRLHNPLLTVCMDHRYAVVTIAACVLIFAFAMIAPNLGTEFIPKLSEGSLAISVVRLAGTDMEESLHVNSRMELKILESFPDEVRDVWSRVGTAEVATDPMGIELTDMYITLHPRSRWKQARTQAELVERLDEKLREFPGQRIAFSQPIELRLNEMISGVRSDLGIKLFGDDFEILATKAAEIETVLKSIPGNADASVEQVTGQPVLQIQIRQDDIARYGVPAQTILDLIQSIGTLPVGEVVEGQLRFPLAVRLPERMRTSAEAMGAILVATPGGERIPLVRLVDIRTEEGPSTITREWGQRRITITSNIRGRDVGSFVAEAQRQVAAKVRLPGGRYFLEWGGQFENYQRASRRLLIVVPVAVAMIFTLLYLTYHNVVDSLRVVTGVPLGWVGGIIALWLRDMPFSISAAVGFIALSGVAVLDDMILVSYVRQLRARGLNIHDAVRQAAVTRLRPVLMTTLVASLGFLPMALSTGQGAEVQRPLATVVIGGVIGAMLMSLMVLRVLYLFFDAMARAALVLLVRGLRMDRRAAMSVLGLADKPSESDKASDSCRSGRRNA